MSSNAVFRPQELQRRKFQEIAAIAIDKQAKAITQTREFMADLSASLDAAKGELAVMQQELKMLREHYVDVRRATLLQRVYWLFTGR